MIGLELKSLHSPDVEVNEWKPERDSAWFLLQLDIGIRGEVAADTFDVMIATPQGLVEHASADTTGALVKRSTIVLQTFSWAALAQTLESILRECQAEDWCKSVLRLQRYFRWEYEDYIEEGRDLSPSWTAKPRPGT